MRCPSPIRLKSDDGIVRDVPCGKCKACIQSARNNKVCQFVAESLLSDKVLFITLTYDDENYSNRNLAVDMRNFIKRYRIQLVRKNIAQSLRYFYISELGTKTGREHAHALLFYRGVNDNDNFDRYNGDLLETVWSFGFVKILPAKIGSLNYVTKYMFKDLNYKSIVRMSSLPPLGIDYFIDNGLILTFLFDGRTNINGHTFTCPKSYKQYVERNWSILSARIQAANDPLYYFVTNGYVRDSRLYLPARDGNGPTAYTPAGKGLLYRKGTYSLRYGTISEASSYGRHVRICYKDFEVKSRQLHQNDTL